MHDADSRENTRPFPERQAWLITTIPLMVYVISLFAPWLCFPVAGSEERACVCGFLGGLWGLALSIDDISSAGSIQEALLAATFCFAIAWPAMYWYLAICWICLERPAKGTLDKFNKVLLSLSIVGAVGALAKWIICFISGWDYVQPALVIASSMPLVSSLLFRFWLFKYSW